MRLRTVPLAVKRVTGIRPPDGTWRRWVLTGIASRTTPGTRIKLRVVKFGGRLMTNETWVSEFFAATSSQIGQGIPVEAPQDTQPVCEAERYLDSELDKR